jgi:transcriptional regulator with XRE-family HTH domain
MGHTMANTLGNKIARIRILENLTQVDMSKRLKVSQSSLSAWENHGAIPPWSAMKEIIKLGEKYNVKFTIEDVMKESRRRPSDTYKRGARKTQKIMEN